jgi:signal transduction histidine kinase
MTRDDALRDLTAGTAHRRLKAAKYLASNATSEDLLVMRQARQIERDAYVRKRLDQAIERVHANNLGRTVSPEAEEPEGISDNAILAKSMELIGGMLLHEMEGPIGRASFYATKEIAAYDDSKTKRELESLKAVFQGIDQLVKASMPPRLERLELVSLIEDVVTLEAPESFSPSVIGPRPFMVLSDPGFLRLAIANGLRNAVEAIEQLGSSSQGHPVVVTWGETDRDIWISIIDHGPGVSGSVEAKFEIGRSTKRGHRGFGLAIARRAMESLQGSVSLLPGTDGGARYELRWARQP